MTIKERVINGGVLTTFASFITILLGIDYIYSKFPIDSTSLVWAFTVTLAFYTFWGLLNYCWYTQSLMQDEIDRQAKVKERLEAQVIKARQTSKRR